MLADVQIHDVMTRMAELTLATLKEKGAGAITVEHLTDGVYQLVKFRDFTDGNADDQAIYAVAAIIVSDDQQRVESVERLLTKSTGG